MVSQHQHAPTNRTQALHGLFNTGSGSGSGSHAVGCPVHGVQSEQHPQHRPGHPSHQTAAADNGTSPQVARSRRSSDQRKDEPINCLESSSDRKCSCDVALVGDYEYYMGPNCDQDASFGIQTMVNLVVGANKIYRETNFDGMTGLGFVVQSAHIYSSTAAPGNPTPHESYASGATYLNAVTTGLENNFTEVCSSMVFTHRDFHEGILGMAWVASDQGFGGICDPKYNCGFNTGINYGIEITPFVQSLVFAHEIGHNCGGEHDPEGDSQCSPGDDAGGNFIMFAAATDGSHGNNHRFSACSKATMGNVMQYLRESCFVEAGLSCGDGIVDGDEECDCGSDCTPTGCCTAECKVNTAIGHVCSPQNPIRFPCCTQACSFKDQGVTCHDDDDCAEDAVCTGESAFCPLSPKENHTECHCMDDNCTANPGTNPQVCSSGICDTFVCEMYGAKQCGLPEPDTCKLGCIGGGFGDGNTCTSTFSGSTPGDFGSGRFLFSGTPCRSNLGMCSPEGQCVLMDPEDAPKSPSSWAKGIVEEYWQESLISTAAVILTVVTVMQYRSRRAAMKHRASSERAYLLAAANEEYEEQERGRVFDDGDGSEMRELTYAEEYAAPPNLSRPNGQSAPITAGAAKSVPSQY